MNSIWLKNKKHRLFAFIIIVNVVYLGMMWWSLCPGYFYKRCWFGARIEGSSEIALAKARYGPLILKKSILENARTMEHPNTAILQLRTLWEHEETVARLILTCVFFWAGLCYMIFLHARLTLKAKIFTEGRKK